jgi:hypothetical protein
MSVDVQYEWMAGTLASDAAQVDRRARGNDNAVVWLPAVILLIVLAGALLWYPLLRAIAPNPITYKHGWIVYWQQATVALMSLGLICLLAGRIATRFSGSWLAGWYAGICPLVWLGVFSPLRFAMNDPQWLGMVPELLGFYVYMQRRTSVSRLCGAAVLFALAVFTKESLVVAPVAVGLDMALMRDWRRLGIFVGSGLLVAGVLLAVTVAVDGHFLLNHVTWARTVSYEAAQHTVMTYTLFFPTAILVGGIWCAEHIGSERNRLLVLGWVVANALGIGLSFGNGVANNIMFEALLFDAIVVAVACQTFLMRDERRRCGMLLMLNAVWPVVLLPAALTDGPHEWDMLGRVTVAFSADVNEGAQTTYYAPMRTQSLTALAPSGIAREACV